MERINHANDKYNGWMGFITSALIATNYTENGWGLTRAPEHITKLLQDRLYQTLEVTKVTTKQECSVDDTTGKDECVDIQQEIVEPSTDNNKNTRKEHFINVIGGDDNARPVMISDYSQNMEILHEMKPIFEEWSGIPLEGSTAYGIRAYRNNSNLLMHVDKSSTHVISGIYHVDRSDDAQPWPIVIEDYKGNTNQVYLEPGDLLFYESSKCFHGRPQTFIGGYYASLFMHYRPVNYNHENINNEIHYAIPQHWHETKEPKEGLDVMKVVGTSFKEPNCKHLLCSLDEDNEMSKNTVNWYGPAPKGKVVTTGWNPTTMTPPESWDDDDLLGGDDEL